MLTSALLKLAFKCGIVVVLDVVVGAAWQVLGDLAPSVSIRLVQLKDKSVLVLCPLDFLDIRVQVVVPSK